MTELFLSTNSRGTISFASGSVVVGGTGTSFTSADVGKKITVRYNGTETLFTISSVITPTLILFSTIPTFTVTDAYYYLSYSNVDLSDEIPWNLTMSIADVRNPEKRNTSYSKTVTVGGSKRNNEIFRNIFEIDSTQGYNANIKAFAELYIDSILVFKGICQLLKIIKREDFIEYEIALYGLTANVLFSSNTTKLNELDYTDLEHEISLTNIVNSWTAPIGVGYVYPLIDRDDIATIGTEPKVDINKAKLTKMTKDEIINYINKHNIKGVINKKTIKKDLIELIINYSS
jgi:hypothetical protein